MRKPRHVFALHVCQRAVQTCAELQSLLGPNINHKYLPSDDDVQWLHSFLYNSRLKFYMQLLDALTDGPELAALADRLRPEGHKACDSLRCLSDVWVDLENFVMQTQDTEEPEAHELYDLLADPHIREVLVAYDDIANSRYSPILLDNVDLVTIYSEAPSEESMKSTSPGHSHRHSSVTNGDDSLGEVTVLSGPPVTHLSENSIQRGTKSPKSPDWGGMNAASEDPTDRSEDDDKEDEVTFEAAAVPAGSSRLKPDPKQISPPAKSTTKRPNRPDAVGGKSTYSEVKPMRYAKNKSASSPTTAAVQKSFPIEQEVGIPEVTENHTVIKKPPIQPNHRTPLVNSPRSHEGKTLATQSPTSPRKQQISSPPSSVRSGNTLTPKSSTPTSPPVGSRIVSHSRETDPEGGGSLRSRQNRYFPPGTTDQLSPQSSLSRAKPTTAVRQKFQQPQLSHEPGQVRSVRLRRDHPGEPIGVTVTVKTPSPPATPASKSAGTRQQEQQPLGGADQPFLVIQRVMNGSLADRQGGLYPGDLLLEFNGRPVHSLDEVHNLMRQTSSTLDCQFVVKTPSAIGLLRPGLQRKLNSCKSKCFIRCFFTYDAGKDALMPAGDIGLSFKSGEVLELVDDQDPNWWQVRSLNDPNGRVRLVPSQTLEERRQAFNQEKAQATGITKKMKRQVKTFFRAADSSGLRLRADIWSYEEVVPWPPTMVPCLLLLGPTGVGRRNLKVLLANLQPKRFGFPLSDTTDPSAPSGNFQILPKAQMERDVRDGAYVEWGQVNGHYYGIRFSAIRKIIDSGRTAVLDCQPQTVHLLHQPEFNPCAIFVAAPNFEVAKQMLQDGLKANLTKNNRSDADLRELIDESSRSAAQHRHLYSHLVINSNMLETVEKLGRIVARIERQPSWIPASWAYELSISGGTGSILPGGGLPTNFIPGSSSLSALGIHGLPPSRASTIAPSVLSGVSAASPESAVRLSRPPGTSAGGCARGKSSSAAASGPIYERRRRTVISGAYRHPLSPTAIQEQDTPTSSVVVNSNQDGNELVVSETDVPVSDLDAPGISVGGRKRNDQMFDQKRKKQKSVVLGGRKVLPTLGSNDAPSDSDTRILGGGSVQRRHPPPQPGGHSDAHGMPRGSQTVQSHNAASSSRTANQRHVPQQQEVRRQAEDVSSTSSGEEEDVEGDEFRF